MIPPPPLDAEAIRASLAGSTPPALLGREVQVFAVVDSTNDTVARAGTLGAGEGLLVFAEAQRAGRGQRGRPWSSAPGLGLWFSILLRPPPETFPHWPGLARWAALGVAEAVETVTGKPDSTRIKWPNDVLLAGRKVAGILIETHGSARGRFAVVGIGINVHQRAEDFPPELRARAGSLAMLAPEGLDRTALAVDALRRLDRLYVNWPANVNVLDAACRRRDPDSPGAMDRTPSAAG